ncbi:MAG: bifunctional phosphoglucose/phosphomannose isomerase [Syntrophomonadaceae bacterium]|nr:bifunctional phosphoglucose/phosphomannose isomerase [Syntrophomonadaceae bacterium]
MATKLISEDMTDALYGLPEQFEYSLGLEFTLSSTYKSDYRNLVISGLGGSAIGGDIIRSYASSRLNIPVVVNRDYDIPAFVNQDTLFVAASYSGNTEETLSSYCKARERGANILCITSGGELALMAAADGFGLVQIPGGLMPRAATGYLFGALILALESIGLFSGVRAELEETVALLKVLREEFKPGIAAPSNQARDIAARLKNGIPVIWGTAGISETVALRWKTQINENAKCPAYYNIFPELNHNELVGFETPAGILSQTSIIILQDAQDNERVQKRIEITSSVIKDQVKDIINIRSRGASYLARFFSLAYLGDYVSVYLADEYGIDPTPVAVIDYLKAELAKC